MSISTDTPNFDRDRDLASLLSEAFETSTDAATAAQTFVQTHGGRIYVCRGDIVYFCSETPTPQAIVAFSSEPLRPEDWRIHE